MKYLCFFLFLISFSNNSLSQDAYLMPAVDTAPVIEECHDSKDTKECFNESLNHHIQSNLDIRKTFHAAGKAYVQFKVSADGQVEEVKVRAEDDKHREEAKRVIELLKIKQPATLNGEKVAVLHSLPITFRTKNYNSMEEYRHSEDFQKVIENKARRQEKERMEIIAFEDLSSPPLFAECESIVKEKECFERLINIKLRLYLERTHHTLKKGAKIKYYFQVDKEGNITNVAVNSSGKLTSRRSTELLESLTFKRPALDNKRDPVKTEYLGELVF